jgi:hypothetical protein
MHSKQSEAEMASNNNVTAVVLSQIIFGATARSWNLKQPKSTIRQASSAVQ